MDREGIPLAFRINPGNDNEQQSMLPLEKVLSQNFDLSRFIVCTDAGLSSNANRYFNNYDEVDGTRDFITTQSIKKLKQLYKKWALDPEGWSLSGNTKPVTYDLTKLDEQEDLDKIYYKSRRIKEKVEVTIDGKKNGRMTLNALSRLTMPRPMVKQRKRQLITLMKK